MIHSNEAYLNTPVDSGLNVWILGISGIVWLGIMAADVLVLNHQYINIHNTNKNQYLSFRCRGSVS